MIESVASAEFKFVNILFIAPFSTVSRENEATFSLNFWIQDKNLFTQSLK